MSTPSITGYFGPCLIVRGTLRGQADVIIDGRVDGELSIDGQVRVGDTATVHANVSVARLDVAGEVHGDVVASDSVHVNAGGLIEGNVKAVRIAIDDGAALNGGIEMDFEMPESADEFGGA